MYRCSKPLLKACIEPALSQADIYFADTSSFSSIGLGGGDLIGKHITQVGACMCARMDVCMHMCLAWVWHGCMHVCVYAWRLDRETHRPGQKHVRTLYA